MKSVGLAVAEELLDFNARLHSPARAQDQLRGAVALHNMLCRFRVAYLADEVGMGKTLVALGVVALLKHFKPSARILIITPRENIQEKWKRELENFVTHNVRFADLRIKAPDGRPAVELVKCDSLLDLLRQTQRPGSGIFFTRMSSFSLGMRSSEADGASKLRNGLRELLPWLASGTLDLRSANKPEFKDQFARALSCGLPKFDLVIVDEGHNLKHGLQPNVAARNRVIALAMGHPGTQPDKHMFPGYSSRAERVLFLSATPMEDNYTQLWNQLDVLGLGGNFTCLKDSQATEDEKKALTKKFLIRRVTELPVGGDRLTKNQYRREWRRGGVGQHDEPIVVTDARQRLTLALVQKKVAEIIGHEKMGNAFQIGMLASFESFQETSVRKKVEKDDAESSNFDGGEQTEDIREREGVDVHGVNRLAKSYRQQFHGELPHPKMDALCDCLSDSWDRGRKTLVFVRRIASVTDLKRKLDERYDSWLLATLIMKLPSEVHDRLRELFATYQNQRNARRDTTRQEGYSTPNIERLLPEDGDKGGQDTFFSWFFRGEGPPGVLSGAALVKRFRPGGSSYATFFEDNHAARLLGCEPGEVRLRLREALTLDEEGLEQSLHDLASRRIVSQAQKIGRKEQFEAMQGAAVELLAGHKGPLRESAQRILHERYTGDKAAKSWRGALPQRATRWLETPTFFTELRRDQWQELRVSLWPESSNDNQALRDSDLRAELLSAAARLGQSVIDLYTMHIQRVRSLELRAQEDSDGDDDDERGAIGAFLELLERQRTTPLSERTWGAYDELWEISQHFDLILDVNAAEIRGESLMKARQIFGTLLGRQQPVGGMSGWVNKTLVKQFRMPGYPFVLVCTDVLQEGEDLHTFCAEVHHYGIAWTPSSMEQRTGRIDRVRSLAERRLSKPLQAAPADYLQVHYPHLVGTIEALQVRRVLERMNTFLRLMHEGLRAPEAVENRVDVNREILRRHAPVPAISERLHSAFPVREEDLKGVRKKLDRPARGAAELVKRFHALDRLRGIEWEHRSFGPSEAGKMYGTATMPQGRKQPFTLRLLSLESFPMLRCVSPVGCVLGHKDLDAAVGQLRFPGARVAMLKVERGSEATYDVTVEGEVLLVDASHDSGRGKSLIERVTRAADELERRLLGLHVDEPLTTFRQDLKSE